MNTQLRCHMTQRSTKNELEMRSNCVYFDFGMRICLNNRSQDPTILLILRVVGESNKHPPGQTAPGSEENIFCLTVRIYCRRRAEQDLQKTSCFPAKLPDTIANFHPDKRRYSQKYFCLQCQIPQLKHPLELSAGWIGQHYRSAGLISCRF